MDVGVREQTTGAGEATVEATRRPLLTANQGTAADHQRPTPGGSQLRPARQLQFPETVQRPDGDGAPCPMTWTYAVFMGRCSGKT